MSIALNALTDSLVLAAAPTYNGSWTVAGWVRYRDINDFQSIVSLASDASAPADQTTLSTNADGTSLIGYYGTGNFSQYGETPQFAGAADTGYYVVLSRDVAGTGANLRMRVFADTAPATPVSDQVINYSGSSAAIITSLDTLRFGGSDLDLISWRVWQGVELTNAELDAERKSVTPARTAGLWAAYAMEDASASATGINDSSGNARHLTAVSVSDSAWRPTQLPAAGGPTLTLFLSDTQVPSGGNFGTLVTSAPTAATSPTGWTVAGLAAGQMARMAFGVERGAGTFSATAQPDGPPDSVLGDGYRTASTLNGTYAAATWTIPIPMIAVDAAGATLRARVRLWRSANADMSGATEITSGAAVGTTVTNLQTGTAQTSTCTVALGAVTLTNEFLFLQVAAEVV